MNTAPYTQDESVEYYDRGGWCRGVYIGKAADYASIVEQGRKVPTHVVRTGRHRGRVKVVGEGHIRRPPSDNLLQGYVAVMKRDPGGFYLLGPHDTPEKAAANATEYKTISGDPVAIIPLRPVAFKTGDGLTPNPERKST